MTVSGSFPTRLFRCGTATNHFRAGGTTDQVYKSLVNPNTSKPTPFMICFSKTQWILWVDGFLFQEMRCCEHGLGRQMPPESVIPSRSADPIPLRDDLWDHPPSSTATPRSTRMSLASLTQSENVCQSMWFSQMRWSGMDL